MNRHPLILVVGGARCGKSRWARERAATFGLPKLFLATAEALDSEMAQRIERHRSERGDDWRTVEEPRWPADVLRREAGQAVVLDCLTLWLANVFGESADADVEEPLRDLLQELAQRRNAVVVVTNEVGWGIVPDNALGRAFRDAAGFMNQRVAAIADEVVVVVAGQALRVK